MSKAPSTVREVAEALKIERDAAYNLIRFLTAIEAVEDRGIRRPEKGGGRGENVYSFSDDLIKKLATVAKVLEAL